MTYDPKKHHRRSIRLAGYDYAEAGAYFVTVCTRGRICLLGDVVAGEMRLNDLGRIVHETWCNLPDHYPQVELDAFIVMPNHVHMIVVLMDSARPDDVRPDSACGGSVWPGSVRAGFVRAGFVRAGFVRAGFKPAPTDSIPPAPSTHADIPRPDCRRPDSPQPDDVRADDVRAGFVRAGFKPAPTRRHGLSEIIRGFKTFSSRRINEHCAMRGTPLWHRNYYEHIIRSDLALSRIRQYIAENPQQWPWDPDNPSAIHPAPPDSHPG